MSLRSLPPHGDMMRTVKLLFALFGAALCCVLAKPEAAQDSLPLTSPAAEQSRVQANQQAEMKRQFRTWQAQYRSMQGLMREEQNKWMGYNPQRPVVNAGEIFNVPYSNLAYPVVPVGRTIFYHGGPSFFY